MVVENVHDYASESSEGRVESLDTPAENRVRVGVGVNLAVSLNSALELRRHLRQERRRNKIRQDATETERWRRFGKKQVSQPVHFTSARKCMTDSASYLSVGLRSMRVPRLMASPPFWTAWSNPIPSIFNVNFRQTPRHRSCCVTHWSGRCVENWTVFSRSQVSAPPLRRHRSC